MDESSGARRGPVDPAEQAEAPKHARTAGKSQSARAAAARGARGLGRGTSAGAAMVGRSGHATARLVSRGSRASARRLRIFTHSGGAGESGLARLIELNAVHSAADAALTVALAGTIFSIPTGEARGQVALFLLLTMAPFTVMAPLVGPLLDRFRHGRRWAIGTTFATRAFLAWVLAEAVVTKSAWLFPAALGALVASRAYNVTRASAVPRLLPEGVSLVSANSRQSLAAVAGMVMGGAVAGLASRAGPDWALRVAFVIYVVGTVLAIRLPARIDSSLGEEDIEQTIELPLPGPRGGLVRRFRRRVDALPWKVLFALWCTAGTRVLAGFLTLYLAFLMRENPIPGLSGALVLGLVVAAAGLGNALGSVIGNLFKRQAPETIAAAMLLAATVMTTVTAAFYSAWTLVGLGLLAGLSGQLAKLSLDALVQREVGETVRTRVFAWSETMLQTAWVFGGALGLALPLNPQLGFGVIAALLVATFILAIHSRVVHHRRTTPPASHPRQKLRATDIPD